MAVSESMMGRISSLKDEENLNQRWVDLLKLNENGSKFVVNSANSKAVENEKITLNANDSNQSICVADL